MSFKIELDDIDIFKSCFDAVSNIVDEVTIHIDTDGVRLKAINRGHTLFVKMNLKRSLFTEFACDEPTFISIDTVELMKVLKRGKGKDKLSLSLSDDNCNLIVALGGIYERVFNIRLIDVDYETPTLPEMDYTAHVDMRTDLFKERMGDVELYSKNVYFTVKDDVFTVSTDGDFGGFKSEYSGVDVNGNGKSKYSLVKINEMLKASKLSESTIINFGNDIPLKVDFNLLGDDGGISFLLAPMLEED